MRELETLNLIVKRIVTGLILAAALFGFFVLAALILKMPEPAPKSPDPKWDTLLKAQVVDAAGYGTFLDDYRYQACWNGRFVIFFSGGGRTPTDAECWR